jgi:signal transduction histidine kinase
MLDNLKLVLLEHRRFLAIFLLIVFIPSILLAFFGIQAINNERYRLQQVNLEQQRGFVKSLKGEVQSLFDKDLFTLREVSLSRALSDMDYPAFSEAISQRLLMGDVRGRVVVWSNASPAWFPGLAERPPGGQQRPIPAQWKEFQSDLKRAERLELRLRNYPEAISFYRQILRRSNDNQVRAWIFSRIARCEVKQKNYTQALTTLRSLIDNFPGCFTESGRSLEVVTRMAILDALLAENNIAGFFRESFQTLKRLDEIFWTLDASQAHMYAGMILEKVDETVKDVPPDNVPEDFQSSLDVIRFSIDKKMEIWRLAEAVRENLLPNLQEKMKDTAGNIQNLSKNILEYRGRDILVLLLPLDSQGSENPFDFLGSLLEFEDLDQPIDTFIESNAPPGISVLFRSNLSNAVLYGEGRFADQTPVLTEFFSENFPPWKVELFQEEGIALSLPLYRNIFFWIILALMVIVFFGSGLIIRTIVQEVGLLNLKSEFIASVSHEFKTPLTAMGAILERLLDDEVKDPQKIREYHRILSHDSEKLKRLIKNVLDFSKIEDGKREYKLIETDIPRLVRKEVDSFLKENRMAGFEVETTIEDEIPEVLADEEALSQALHNILDNAAKFSGREKKIDVEVKHKEHSVEISVQDRGIGIPESERKKVFEKFYRGKQASAVSPTGTGLGLTLVRHILDGHGGNVVISSQPEKGSRVSLILPLAKGV